MSEQISQHWPGLSEPQAEYVDHVIAHTDTNLVRQGKRSNWVERFGTYDVSRNALQMLVDQVIFRVAYLDDDTTEPPDNFRIYYANRRQEQLLVVSFEPEDFLDCGDDDEPFFMYLGDNEPYYEGDETISNYVRNLCELEEWGLLKRVDTDPQHPIVRHDY